MDIFPLKVFGEDGSAMLSGVLDVVLQAALLFCRGLGRSWAFPSWSLLAWVVGTGTAEFLAGDRQGKAFIYKGSLGESPGKQGERKGAAGEFGSMVKGRSVVRFGVIFQKWRVTRGRDTWTQVRG